MQCLSELVDIANDPTTFISRHFQIIRTTGFMKGLYGENEMKSDNVKVRFPHSAQLVKHV